MTKLSIVIPTMNGREKMLQELYASIHGDHEIIIERDHGGPSQPLSLAEKRNLGYQRSKGEFILFIDDDNILEKGSIPHALRIIRQYKNIGIVGFIGCYSTDKEVICDSGSYRGPMLGFTYDFYVNKTLDKMCKDERNDFYPVDEVANAFLVRRKVFEEVGLFDANNFPMDLDEADLCFRARKAGYQVVMSTSSIVYHNSITYSRIPKFRRKINAYNMAKNRIIFHKKHKIGLLFLPFFIALYSVVILFGEKPKFIYHFLRGVKHGLFNPVKNPT